MSFEDLRNRGDHGRTDVAHPEYSVHAIVAPSNTNTTIFERISNWLGDLVNSVLEPKVDSAKYKHPPLL